MKILTLFWFVAGLATGSAVAAPFNVRDHGVKGDGQTNDQRAIQAAIDACVRAGGGTVVVPPGNYRSGALRLASGVTLHLEKGATLWASTNKDDYAADSGRHFLVAENAERVHLAGEGIINGQGVADYGDRWGVPEKPAFRVGMLWFKNCRAVSVRDVRFQAPRADSYARRSKPVGGRRTTRDERDTVFARLPSYFTVAHARGLRLEHVRVNIAEGAFLQFPRSAFCGRFIEGGVLLNVRRSPAEADGGPPPLDLQNCRAVTVRP